MSDTRPTLIENDKALVEALRTRTPFRTYPRSDRDGLRYQDGVYYGLQEPILHREHEELKKLGYTPYQTGGLIDHYYTQFVDDTAAGIVDFVIYSYDTVIAWHRTDGTWEVADMVMTATTSNHQIRTFLALRQLKE